MANPLFNMLNNSAPQMSGRFGDFMNMMSQFNQFKQNFTGDPKQYVLSMLNSGQMTQDQFNQLQALATQFQKMMSR